MSPDGMSGVLPEWFTQMGAVAWPLAVCSVLALAISLERAAFLIRSRASGKLHLDALAGYLRDHHHQPKPVRDEYVGIALTDLRRSYHSGLKLLRLIGMISPMLGLLGTILGMISTFKVISEHTGAVSPALLADGLWEAMLTTAAGLSIALPTLFLAYLFSSISDRRLEGMCAELNRLSLSLEMAKYDAKSNVVGHTPEVRRL